MLQIKVLLTLTHKTKGKKSIFIKNSSLESNLTY